MLREIITPISEDYQVKIPKAYLNKEIEILIFPLTPKEEYENIIEQTAGIISNKEDPIKWQQKIRDEYER